MNKIKFVGGPFHGEEHEVDDDCVEMRLPVLKDTHGNIDYIRYTKPKENKYILDFFYGMGKLLEQNGFVK